MKGFQIHTKAVRMEEHLQQAMRIRTDIQIKELTDITMIYDRPIQLCGDVLTVLENRIDDPNELATIQDIKRKYCRYHSYICVERSKKNKCKQYFHIIFRQQPSLHR